MLESVKRVPFGKKVLHVKTEKRLKKWKKGKKEEQEKKG